jgi:hypothetical protein
MNARRTKQTQVGPTVLTRVGERPMTYVLIDRMTRQVVAYKLLIPVPKVGGHHGSRTA